MLIDQQLHFPLASKPSAFREWFEITKQTCGNQQVNKPNLYALSVFFFHYAHGNPLVLVLGSRFLSAWGRQWIAQ